MTYLWLLWLTLPSWATFHYWPSRRRERFNRNFPTMTVKRDRVHVCSKPLSVERFNKRSGISYEKGDVIECKSCGQMWKCIGREQRGYGPQRWHQYMWRETDGDEVFK